MRIVIALVALSMVPLSVGAQVATETETETGSRVPIQRRARIPDGSDGNADAARIVAADFVRCVVARNPSGVASVIDLPPGPASSKAMTALATDECLDEGEMRIPQRLMRGAIFVELYRVREVKKVEIAARRPIDLNFELAPEYQQDPLRYAILSFGDCVIKRDTRDARDVVLLQTASKAQNAAFRALIPNLGPCLLEGQKITFSKPIIEGVLAEVLYRGTVEPVTAPESK